MQVLETMVGDSPQSAQVEALLMAQQGSTLSELCAGWGHVTQNRGTFVVNPDNLLQSAMFAFARAGRAEFAEGPIITYWLMAPY